MWSPTHMEVTIKRARGLLTKGKNGTNNCFVAIALDKQKYQTSVKEKAETNVSWEEECELKIPDQGNRAELVLTCWHLNSFGMDEFLGQVNLPLNEMDVHDRPRPKWYKLGNKPGKEKKNKERGELEVRINFKVKSGSLSDLSKKEKHKSSIGQLASSVGGSLLSIGTIEKRKGIKKFAKSLGSKMHLHSKKKNKEGDEGSFNGSFASIGTPNNGGNRRNGQRAGEADPGVISEDEDEFVLDNLSQKSSTSSLSLRQGAHLHHGNGGKQLPQSTWHQDEFFVEDDLEQIENDFSVRARTLPPPSKPPRTPQQISQDAKSATDKQLDEWETKLYGKHLEIGSVDSLKRRSWDQSRVPLPQEPAQEVKEKIETTELKEVDLQPQSDSSSSLTESDIEEEEKVPEVLPKPQVLEVEVTPKSAPRAHLLSPNEETNNFQQLNSSFSKYEKLSKINDSELFKQAESKRPEVPQPLPRVIDHKAEAELKRKEEEKLKAAAELKRQQEVEAQKAAERKRQEEQQRAALEMQKLKEEEQKRREEKRREEDQRLLDFTKRSVSGESDANTASTPEQSPKERTTEKRDKRLSKYKFFGNRRDKNEDDHSSPSPTSTERIIIGHEKSTTHAERRSEISAALAKKYEGKSREELMLIANGMENEALLQRQRVKELEDYLDNLLLRVMETHPKILQSPYSRTTSAKSFKNYINMNDYL